MTLKDGLDLLNQCQFDLLDPFELDTEIIQVDSLTDIVIEKFKLAKLYISGRIRRWS